VLGRETTCHVPVIDTSVSRMHASIEWIDGACHITDLNSTNGSWVNEHRLRSQVRLEGGELIRLGNTILKFMMALDEEAQYHAVVHDLITRDSLTGVFNRGFLFSLLHRELQAARQQGTTLSLILTDIDRFKRVNDRFGHLIGDEVVRNFCERIRLILDKTHTLCRYGGDEFVIVCPATSLEMTVQFAELIRQEVAETPFETQAGNLKVTCSMGVTRTDGKSLATADAMLGAADKLLYRAKDQGRDCVHCAGKSSIRRTKVPR
jgi:diguanylate cyclase (GGDEF)-like protein